MKMPPKKPKTPIKTGLDYVASVVKLIGAIVWLINQLV
jgi:hypothetical protein